MRSRFLDVAQGHARVEGGGDERVPKGVRADRLADLGAVRDPAEDPPGAVPVQPPPICGQEHGAIDAFRDGQVDRPGSARRKRDGDDLAALAGDRQRPVPALQAQMLDTGAGGLRDPKPIQGEQGDQRVLERRPEPGGDQECTELVAVQGGSVRFVVQPGPRTRAAGE
jgi:hypothetical protein